VRNYEPEPNAGERGHVSVWGIERPAEGTICMVCARNPGRPQRCPSDGAWHRHGMIHRLVGDSFPLVWVCDDCAAVENERDNDRRNDV
jgi:hypothetical protein